MRRIMKPTKEQVECYLASQAHIAYQHVNWWLYQKGSDEIIWSYNEDSSLNDWCFKNKEGILAEMAEMVGAETPEDKYGRLLGKTFE